MFIWTIPLIKQMLCVLVYRRLMYNVLFDAEHGGLPSCACGLQLPVSKLTELRTSQRMV
jgi:hypothetical protein